MTNQDRVKEINKQVSIIKELMINTIYSKVTTLKLMLSCKKTIISLLVDGESLVDYLNKD